MEPLTPTDTIGGYLLNRLHDCGVRHIFGIPGDYVLRFDKLIEQHRIQFINATRENTAGYLADAYARLRGIGVACVTYGVGINIVNATSQAYVESSPLVIISGAPGLHEMSRTQTLHHQINPVSLSGVDLTQMEIFKMITVDQARLENGQTAAASIDRVLQACLFHKKPVYIELPRDQVDTLITLSPSVLKPCTSDLGALEEAIGEVSRLLLASHRPIIWVGHEVRRRCLAEPLIQFAERFHIPIVSTLAGKSVVDEHHPLFVGLYQGEMSLPQVKEYAHRCDTALILGVIMTDVDTGNFTAKLGDRQRIAAYPTSVNIGHHTYPHILLNDLIHALAKLDLTVTYPQDFPRWTELISTSFQVDQGAKTTTRRLFECLQSHLGPEHIVVSDIGDCLFGAADLILNQDSFLACSLFASLGFGIPAAVAAQMASPGRRVIAVIGDGAFQMTATELATAVYYKQDPIIIVLNNHGYGMERPLLEGRYNDILNWDYAKIPMLFGGGYGTRVTTEEEFEYALCEALNRRGLFTLIEVELGKTDFSSGMHRFGALFGKVIPH